MRAVGFERARDLERLDDFLAAQYLENGDASSWLPARLHDVVWRVAAEESDEGRAVSSDHIFLLEEGGGIAACILPDGENVYLSVRKGYESLFPAVIECSERECLPLFPRREDGTVKFWFAVSSRCAYMMEALSGRGYVRYPEEEYALYGRPEGTDEAPAVPDGFRLLYGEEYADEETKWSALRLGFHPEREAPGFRASMLPYRQRKRSALYKDSFECIVTDGHAEGDNDVCAYSFVYVDRNTGTALIEPVSTRERYRYRGFGTAMIRAAVRRCGRLGVEKCYVNAFGGRKNFYLAAGFSAEGAVSFWHKTMK